MKQGKLHIFINNLEVRGKIIKKSKLTKKYLSSTKRILFLSKKAKNIIKIS